MRETGYFRMKKKPLHKEKKEKITSPTLLIIDLSSHRGGINGKNRPSDKIFLYTVTAPDPFN